jgi:predicted MPP superfamily phosphohydrolase
MRLGFVVFTVVLGLLLYALNRYVWRKLSEAFALSPRARRALAFGLGGSLLAMMLGRMVSRLLPITPVKWIVAISSSIELAVIITGVFLLVADGVRLLARLAQRVAKRGVVEPPAAISAPVESPVEVARVEAAPATAALEVPRRSFLTQAAAGTALAVGSGSSAYGALIGRSDYTIEDVPIKLPGLARAYDGFTIVQLSDLHIGEFVGEEELAAAEALVRDARPDLIVLTGDLLDNHARFAPKLGAFARRLSPIAREGVVAISGNHDYFAGIDPVVEALEAGGARVLRNRGHVIGAPGTGFALLGVDDVWARRGGGGPDLDAALASLPKLGGKIAPARDLPRVLLCHNPSFFEEASDRVDLQLSGHTHGGQVNLLIRPADFVLPNGWVAGRYERGASQLYVNRGFGTVGPPARLGAPPEITRIVLTA